MAIYHCTTKPISRSAGRSAVAAAAYRAGSRLVDERTGRVHDYTRKQGVVSATVLLPDGTTAARSRLWNAAEAAERRKDSRTAREWVVALPSELDASQRQSLAHAFGTYVARRYGVAVDVSIHRPDQEGDQRNHHAHILTTTRKVRRCSDGSLELSDKATLEQSDRKRREQGLGASKDEIKNVRARWAGLANRALKRAHITHRIDHRSYAAQGIDKVASTHLGPVASAMERRGDPSERGDLNRTAAAINQARAQLIDLNQERQRRALMVRAEQAPDSVRSEYDAAWQTVRNGISAQASRLKRRIRDQHARAARIRDRHDSRPPEQPSAWMFWKHKAYSKALEIWQEKGRRLRLRCEVLSRRFYRVDALKAPSGRSRSPGDRLADQRLARQHPDLAAANHRAAQVQQQQQREATLREQKARQQQRDRERTESEFKRMALKRKMGASGFTDRSIDWQAIPAALQQQLDEYNRHPKPVQEAILARVTSDQAVHDQVKNLLDKSPKDRGLSL